MTPLPIPGGVRLASLAEIPESGALVAHAGVGETRVVLILTRRGERVWCFRNRCAHANYPLQRADGKVVVQEGHYLVCAAHGASYALDTGACAGGPCNGVGLERVAVSIRDGAVFTA